MSSLSSNDWAIIGIAAAVATALATLASLALSMFWRALDRPMADWIVFDSDAWWLGRNPYSGEHPPPGATGTLANAGDGIALAVKVRGVGCQATLARDADYRYNRPPVDLVPALRPGEQVHFNVFCSLADWDRARVAVTWRPTPARFRRRRYRYVPLQAIAAPPTYSQRESDVDGFETNVERPELAPQTAVQSDLPMPPPWWRLASRLRHSRELRES